MVAAKYRLTGKRVLVKISDPWELGESVGWEALAAEVVAERQDDEGGALVVRLQSPIVYKDLRCEYFVARPRHSGSEIGDVVRGRPVLCAITHIHADRLRSEDPFDLSWWRGGVAGTAEVAPE